jgi:hypothetical protein
MGLSIYASHWRLTVKLWKAAILLAAVGALAAPFIVGTWKVMSEKAAWVPLTEERRQEIEEVVNDCQGLDEGYRSRCEYFTVKPLKQGGEWVYRPDQDPDLLEYWAINL